MLIVLLPQLLSAFRLTQKGVLLFILQVLIIPCAHWDGFCYHPRDFLWGDIFNSGASATTSEFYGWVQVGIDVYILDFKYQLKPQSSL